MAYSKHISQIFESCKLRGENEPQNTFDRDMHYYAKNQFFKLPVMEKISQSTCKAFENQKIYIEKTDRLIGRIFHSNNAAIEEKDTDFEFRTKAYRRILEEIEDYKEFAEFPQVVGDNHFGGGHISWNWNEMLKRGTSGLKAKCQLKLDQTDDIKKREYYKGVISMLTALENWNDKHVKLLEEMGMHCEAEICRKVPRFPAVTFREALQSFYMQYIAVMRENPGGGNSPGRLDYYLWEYLERDLKENRCTLAEARELIDELFLRINERIWTKKYWVETIVVGGCDTNGKSSVNPLSYIMIESIMDLDIIHPAVYARLSEDSPKEWIEACARYMAYGKNRGQVLYDKNIINALVKNGVPFEDATDYYCGGCMEIGIQGKTNDYLFNAWHNMPKMLELFVTGGESLSDGRKLSVIRSKGLENYESFENFYGAYLDEVKRIFKMFFRAQDIYSEETEKASPKYLLTSMVDDCIEKGLGIHSGGARYSDCGSLPIGLADCTDYLFAIKTAVFDKRICTAAELLLALRANFVGFEDLRQKLISIPKYGQANKAADSFAKKYFQDISSIYTGSVTRFGGKGKMIVFTFMWASEGGRDMGATASGRKAGTALSHGITPHSLSMTEGITSAINSCTAIDYSVFNGGASAMWDLSPEFATPQIIKSLFMTYFKQGGQIFQGNTTDVNELLKARENPEAYHHLFVRVGGFSARFVGLAKSIQDEIITRIRHNK